MKISLKEQDVTILNSIGDENQLDNKIKKLASQVSETINLINNTFNTFMNSSMIELLENNNQKLKQLNDKADNLDDILSNIQSQIMKLEDIINENIDDNTELSQEQKNYYDKKLTDLANLDKISRNQITSMKLNALEKLTYKISSVVEFEVEDDGAFQNLISKM